MHSEKAFLLPSVHIQDGFFVCRGEVPVMHRQRPTWVPAVQIQDCSRVDLNPWLGYAQLGAFSCPTCAYFRQGSLVEHRRLRYAQQRAVFAPTCAYLRLETQKSARATVIRLRLGQLAAIPASICPRSRRTPLFRQLIGHKNGCRPGKGRHPFACHMTIKRDKSPLRP